ncbi:PREDICTED: uncharacterized protein LOC107068873 [Polistes dominula]|uniref:Uncharacterized protein LOC107068873 n=1 Tax=Polistes dominula TaxID=743375 RepID=A0ABM1ILU3_POLDO|nr:PREDICTED: uncharacterized protein LOC107068873 [Polistes dominula]
MKSILLIATIQDLFVFSLTIGGVIWNKNLGVFVPIFSINRYWIIHQEVLSKKRLIETHNFHKEIIEFTYFEESNIVSYSDNDTKVSGLAADIWNLLSESLNFTLKTIRSDVTTVGTFINENGNITYQGLLGLLQQNKTDVVPKIGMYSKRVNAARFTPALWKTPHRLFLRVDPAYSSGWVLYLFDWNVWYFIAATYVLLTICGYISQLVFSCYIEIKQKADLIDHCFYNFGMLCKQGCIPEEFEGRSRIIELSLSLFCTIMHIAFSVLVFAYMTTKIVDLPTFNDLISLKNKTNYNVVIVNGSVPYIAFKISNVVLKELWKSNRLLVVETDEEMYEQACFNDYVMFFPEDVHDTKGDYICQLEAVGQVYFETWVASGISKKFKYKRTIDMGVIKLLEIGLIDRLKKQIKANKKIYLDWQQPDPVEMEQVSTFFLIPCFAAILASIIFVIENLVFVWNQRKYRLQKFFK